ncbi:hypothetical protein PR048_012031 [Dryococelus australis]|uniref:Uncharacterized protein n=1 Tax=Dryococelus australis TaxID=614101 RepID=A0ABQ9HN66_9NEOP|nr:hypothetical protein PR048_012031 [Dryococelus australis]
MERCQNARAREMRAPQENPPTSGIIQHESHMRSRWESNLVRHGERAGMIGEEFKMSANFVRNTFDKIKEEMVLLREKFQEFSIEEIKHFRDEMEEFSQYHRWDNLEIYRVPELYGENVYIIVCDIAKVAGVNLTNQDISVGHRIPTHKKEMQKPIIAKFVHRWKKEEILKAKKSTKDLTSQFIGIRGQQYNIYINHHLTDRNKALPKQARDLRSQG